MRFAVAAVTVSAFGAAPAAAAVGSDASPAVRPAALSAPSGAESAAATRARTSGLPTIVDALTTPYATTVANPDGSFTMTQSVVPVRAKRAGAWVPADATLARNPDGTISPRAAVHGLRLSGGGGGPLATMDDGAGHTFSVTWPTAVPSPVVSGSTATYPDVLPGVDLALSAATTGAVSEVLVVKNSAAAASPALRDIRLAIHAPGLVLSSERGALSAKDAKTGAVAFAAPAGTIWDSAAAGPTAPPALATGPSNVHGPGGRAHVEALGLRAGASGIDLLPDAAALSGPAVRYPVYVDPPLTPTPTETAWTFVSQVYHTQNYLNGANSATFNGKYVARVGYDDWTSGSNADTWSYFRIGSLSALHGTYVESATLQLTQVSASCPSSSYTGKLYARSSNGIDTSTTYDHQPSWNAYTDSGSIGGANGQYNVGVTDMMQNAANGGYADQTLGVYVVATNTTDHCTYRYLDPTKTTFAITYWHRPNVPSALSQTSGGANVPCNSTSPGAWIPKSDLNTVSLNATFTTPDNGYTLQGDYEISVNGGAYVRDTVSGTAQSGGINSAASSITLSPTSTPAIADGTAVAWHADGDNLHPPAAGVSVPGYGSESADSVTCYFRVDDTSPVAAAPTSTDFPQQGGGKTAGQAGVFTFAGTDGGPNPSGVDHFLYNLGGSFTGTSRVAASSGGATVSITPPVWGTNTLWAAAVDKAGNQSQPMSYSFFAPSAPYTPGVTGDITGDGKPDLLAVDRAGNLRIYSDPQPSNVNANPANQGTSDPLQYGGTVLIPGTQNPLWQAGTFAGALVTHGGSFSGKNVDDVMVVQNGSFYVEQNIGNGTGWGSPVTVSKPTSCTVPAGYTFDTCTGTAYSSSWSAVKQMVDVPPATAAGRPGLITLEENNGQWAAYYYAPAATGVGFASATLVADSTPSWRWSNMTLMYAGDADGDGKPDLMVRENTGNIGFFSNIEAGVNVDPYTARILVSGTGGAYTPSAYPYVASDQAAYGGKPTIWAVAANGVLTAVPVTPGATPAFGSPVTISNTGWGGNLQAVEDSYAPFNNTGIWNNNVAFTNATSFDNYGGSYSQQALTDSFTAGPGTAGLYTSMTSGVTATGLSADTVINTNDGADFSWPSASADGIDNFQATGQTIPAPLDEAGTPGATYPITTPITKLSLLGAASGSPTGVSGTATVTWSDGTKQTVTITFSDWVLNNGAAAVDPANQDLGSTPYRLVTSGAEQATVSHLFEDTIQLNPPNNNVQLASITLPAAASGVAIHIFATAGQ